MSQNLHPKVQSHLILLDKPKTFSELFALASTMTTEIMKLQVSAVEVSLQGEPKGVQNRNFVFRQQ
jgi:ribosomal protein L31